MTLLCIIAGPKKVLREESAGELWCFGCRERLPHVDTCLVDEEPSYYDPVWVRRCSRCKRDCTAFPGTA